ncbi:MAG: type II toxin-antitoxin system HicA family toxin, partial [Bacteroidota bacterium]|nr:type II toxin-antitoxin system HicA family toxin [Bacteroidota bacterium]
NIYFSDLCNLLYALGFEERVRGSHHIFTKVGVEEIINLQPKGSQAKPYQVKQVRNIILKYKFSEKL